MKISQKTSLTQNKLLKIENSEKHNRYISKLMANNKNKQVVILIR